MKNKKGILNMKLDIAPESKSLMRMIESVELLERELRNGNITEEKLRDDTISSYLSGILLLHTDGTVWKE